MGNQYRLFPTTFLWLGDRYSVKSDTNFEVGHLMDTNSTGTTQLKKPKNMWGWRRRACHSFNCFLFWLLINSSIADEVLASELLIVFPEAPAPYSKVFEDIIKGVSSQYTGTIHRLQTSSYSDGAYVRERLANTRPDIILALGSHNVTMLSNLNVNVPIIAGALSANPTNMPGISIFPDPVVVMQKLLLLSPGTDRVSVVTALNSGSGYLDEAKIYMASLGKKLIVYRAGDIHAAAIQYLQALKTAEAYDGIWILPGETGIDDAIMGQLLQSAWDKNIVLFSSNPNDVRKGTLFAAYPDNEKMGQDLGLLVNKQLTGEMPMPHFTPVKQLLLAVNLRTSRHLGLPLSGKIRSDIHLEL